MPSNDSEALTLLGYALGDLQDRYRDLPPGERAGLRPSLDEAFQKYQDLRILLLAPGDLVTDDDLAMIRSIQDEIGRAADKQSLLEGAFKIVGFAARFLI